jgi:hypothetical protein
MVIRTLRDSESLDVIWEDLVNLESRLSGDENAKEFAPAISDLIARLEGVRSRQYGTWREEIAAQAAMSAVDDELADWTRTFGLALTNLLGGDMLSPRFRRYFSAAPWTVIRLGLESELGRVRGWVDSLADEPEQVLKDLGLRLRKLVEQGESAVERRRKATSMRIDHHVRSITPLIDDINGARLSLYVTLSQRAVERRLSSEWAIRFFQRGSPQPNAPARHNTPAPVEIRNTPSPVQIRPI